MKTSIVSLQYSEQSRQVKAEVHFAKDQRSPMQIDEVWIQDLLTQYNYQDYYILPEGITALKAAYRAQESTTIAIAEKRDAEVYLTIEENKMQAFINIKQPWGGAKATLADVMAALQASKITHGIDYVAIQNILQQDSCSHVLVAAGVYPNDGENGYFKVLIVDDDENGPKVSEDGVTNFLTIHEPTLVQRGEPLMRKIPRTLGKNGYDVFGNLMYAVPGKNVNFSKNLIGATINDVDENLLEAAISGHPIVEKETVRVDPVYVVDKVDRSTGHVNFDGSVLVRGDVDANMKVVATGDITINGCAIKAHIEAGGRLIISQGIIGGDAIREADGSLHRGSSILGKAGLTTSFIDNAHLEIYGNILVKDYIANSDIACGGDIIVGSTGYRGYIVGGTVSALHCINANVLGSNAQSITKIQVGVSLELQNAYDIKANKLKEHEATLNSVSKALIEISRRKNVGGLNKQMNTLRRNLIETLKFVAPAIRNLSAETHILEAKLCEYKTAKIIVRQRLFVGVELNICEKKYTVTQDTVGGVWTLLSGEINIGPIGKKAN